MPVPTRFASGPFLRAFFAFDEHFLLGKFGVDWGFVFGGEFPERRDPSVVQKADSFRMTGWFIIQVPAYLKTVHSKVPSYAGSQHSPRPLSS